MNKIILTLLCTIIGFSVNAGFYAHHDDRISHPPIVIDSEIVTVEVSCEDGSTVTVIVVPGQSVDLEELEATYCPIVVDPI